MLSAFNNLGYSVEWRVLNAADYGGAQRRRRVFLFAYRNDCTFAKKIDEQYGLYLPNAAANWNENAFDDYVLRDGFFARQFPVVPYLKYDGRLPRRFSARLPEDIINVSDHFSGRVWNAGIMRYGRYFSIDTQPTEDEMAKAKPIRSILQPINEVDKRFFVSDTNKIDKFHYLRGPKKIVRVTPEGHEWTYSEGGMAPHDSLDLPARTMLTSEGTINRSTHLIKIGDRYRLLTPLECERLNDCPDDWTRYKLCGGKQVEVTDSMRYFIMGNALVTGIIKRIGDELQTLDSEAIMPLPYESVYKGGRRIASKASMQ
jgi:DNA (cytosine-5)-methyltransferase 1